MKKTKPAASPENVLELLRELSALRTRVDESAEQFSLGVKARIDEIVHALGSVGAPDAGHILPDPRLVTKIVKRLKSLSQRQARGRAKDLKRISDLVSFLSEALLSRE
jgi:hypothetical protein